MNQDCYFWRSWNSHLWYIHNRNAHGRDIVGQTCDFMLAEFAKHIEDEALVNRGWDDLLACWYCDRCKI
ncbi:MAG: hypothetical protein GDA56_22115 [Hormoscilla sp. GM7CHS1pb]|nr:hypothetical protein [Hormoscilla sp. GM7CHS1pb]